MQRKRYVEITQNNGVNHKSKNDPTPYTYELLKCRMPTTEEMEILQLNSYQPVSKSNAGLDEEHSPLF